MSGDEEEWWSRPKKASYHALGMPCVVCGDRLDGDALVRHGKRKPDQNHMTIRWRHDDCAKPLATLGKTAKSIDAEYREASALVRRTCGHLAGTTCAECYRVVAARANDMAVAWRERDEEMAVRYELMNEATAAWRQATDKYDVLPNLDELLAWLLQERKR